MALVSPGVQVTVTDESFFIPAQAPTVPLIFIATAEDKFQPDGVTPAIGTQESNVVRTVTSLRQSTELYGVPRFIEDASDNQHHGDARNEYGVFALNQFLGVGNRAFVVRANVNLDDDINNVRDLWDNSIEQGAFVLENAVTDFINEYNEANNLVPADSGYKTTVTEAELLSLAEDSLTDVFDKYSFSNSHDNFFDNNSDPASPTSGSQLVNFGGSISAGTNATGITDNATGAYQEINFTPAITNPTDLAAGLVDATTYGINVNPDGDGSQVIQVTATATYTYQNLVDDLNTALTGAGFASGNPVASIVGGRIRITAATTGAASTMAITDVDLVSTLTEATTIASAVNGADSTVYTATIAVDGVNFAVAENGANITTFNDVVTQVGTVLGASATIAIVDGNLKVTSAATGDTSTISITDGTLFSSLNGYVGILAAVDGQETDTALEIFANGYDVASTGSYLGFEGVTADWVANSLGGTIAGQWTAQEASDTVIAAADDYKFTKEFKNETSLGENDAARRSEIVTALNAVILSNTDVQSELYEYNLILCPGYHETVVNMEALSTNIKGEAMVIADTPMNMDSSEVVAWSGTSARRSNTNIAYYYPGGLASNLDGKTVMCAASGIALRTITFSDNVSQLWFAPAGIRRGVVSGTQMVGYVSGTLGSPTTFNELVLNEGQRDNLYKDFTNINPITFFPGRGLIVWGQKTSALAASALDRINVSRLVMYIKRQLRKNSLPFVFEPNDQITRDNLKAAVDGFLGDLVIKRGLYDFATVCDETNNTPDRIDRNEMYLDVAIKPVKAAEFIFIPIRVVSTGADI